MKKISFFCLLLLHLTTIAQQRNSDYYREKYRPQFHFTPAKNWTNDPNGLVYFRGEYHLFYQYNPFGNRWGHMSWGHAVSKDLVHWEHLPLAIPEEGDIMIFSGSCVVDEHNTSGFAKPGETAMVAIYTAHLIADPAKPDDYKQSQHIAFSVDAGRTWKKYSGNPVLDINKKDFRDPKVFWYAPQQKWIMALVLPHEHIVQFYASKNLKQWQHLSNFGPYGDIKDIWECPDLLQVPLEGDVNKKKWVLFNSQQTTVQYFVGEFDATEFKNQNPSGKIYRQDYGPDYYAVVTYNNLPAGSKPVSIGWANNWTYANDIPTNPWKSAMSLPRQLSLKKINGEWILLQQSIPGLQALRTKLFTWKGEVKQIKVLPLKSQTFELDVTFNVPAGSISGLHLAVGDKKQFIIGYDSKEHKLFIDRSNASDTSFHNAFDTLSKYEVPLKLNNGNLRLHVFFDKSIIEVYANDGEAVLTTQIFTAEKNNGIELFNYNNTMKVSQLKFWELRSAWK